MNMELVKQFLILQDSLREEGVIGINVWEKEVQVSCPVLFKFADIQVEKFNYEPYTHRAFTFVDGVKIIAVLTPTQYQKYFGFSGGDNVA